MAAKYCEPCIARGKTPTAYQWCTECEEALCSECTEAHKVQKMSRSHHLVDIEALEKLKKNRRDNSSRLELEETKIRKEIAKAKENVMKRYEFLEKSLLKQLTELKDKDITGMKHQEKDIGELVTSIKDQKEALDFIKDHGSDKQAFISIHSSKPILDDIEKKVKQMTDSFVNTSLMFVKSVKDNLADLGSIQLKKTPCFVSMVPKKQRQSQVPVVSKRHITSLTHLYDIDMKEKLRAVTAIPGTTTAVMFCRYQPYIQLIDIDRQQIIKQVEVKQGECYGVDATKDNIYIGSKGKIYVLDLRGNFVRTIHLKNVDHYVNYISVCSNGNICYSYNNEVQCITSVGEPVFSYTSPDLQDARGIQIDDAGNIYVLGRDSQNIHILTSSGTRVDILSPDNLYKPLTFHYNKKLSKVYIANNDGGKISVFKTK
ncbi:unnamed protein product [Mytilus edulis]|uniref:B box-type domain-containing protein n=1 Tax=Mytilus edulis TaxID=6550 RepID=A0A8S3ST95_MYTED|nr:unnamed protein product [Mytilus edulis]